MGAAVVNVMLSLWKLCCTKTPKSETNSIGMELIEIPAGKFTMGSPWDEENRFDDREEQVEVTLTKPFGLGKTEVTQGQWKQVMGTEPWDGQNNVLADKDCPATYVSWDDATKFCGKLTDLERKAGKLKGNEEYRLPTEAEWEYACRAGTTTAFSFGDESKLNAGEIKAGPGNASHGQYSHKVSLKKPNQWGLHDMHGNAWEWCSDWYGGDLPSGTDPIGPKGGSSRVDRGGCWWGSRNYRNGVVPSFRGRNLGFRVVRSQSRPVQLETNSIGMELIEIPAGKFTMGSPWDEENRFDDREKQVEVTLTKPFGLGKTEVTQGQWKQVMGTEPWDGQNNVLADKDCPATYVSWDDATKFCGKLTDLERKAGKLKGNEEYRLPTEAEWEYACRAGTTTAFSFGDESKLNAHAWWGGLDLEAMKAGEIKAGPGNASHEQCSHKVGLKKPNPWGLYDMHGNVWEWCSDWYGKKLLGGADPVGSEAGSARVGRGGSWWSAPGLCRSALRSGDVPSFRNNYLGFRVVRSQSETRAEWPVQLETNSIGMELIEIPAGKFTMGSPAWEKDRRAGEEQVAVTLRPFMLGKTEVTQGQWKQVMGTEPWDTQNNVLADKDCPATYVSFFDAVEFCKTLTDLERKAGKLEAHEKYRLPTEAEREYACRVGTTTDAWGVLLDFEGIKAVKCEAGLGNTFHEQYPHKVGLKKPNRWGLYDMHGNVGEWCSDWYGEKLLGGTDPVGSVGGSDRPLPRFFCVGFRVARSQSRPVQLETNSIGMELIEIPAGKFTMGSPAWEKDRRADEGQVEVTLTKPFGLGKTEVTQGQWMQVMRTEPWDGQQYVQADNDWPATLVSFFDAVEFCNRLTDLERKAGKLKGNEEYRLPTEAEWEYACRAGTTTAFSFGDESKLNAHAWWGGDLEAMKVVKYEQYPHKVGLKKPNRWGLYDMHGNVGEWCSDWYGEKLLGGTDPVGSVGGSDRPPRRVNRGDSWRYYSGRCRSAFRDCDDPSLRFFCIGFRVARSESETNSIGTPGYGAVSYSYQIGAYDVTGSEYAAFLNAVGSTDTYALYDESMGTDTNEAQISQSSSSGTYAYAVLNSTGNRPISCVSWFDCARFSNWMSNGQPRGDQNSTTTENGTYNVNGATFGWAVAVNATNPNTSSAPTFRIPLENEWHKAAYYSPNYGGTGVGGYYFYATQSDTDPGTTIGSSPNQANYNNAIGHATDVGAVSGSFYGTFDQTGNVHQWNDLNGTAGSSRGYRGSDWSNSSDYVSSSYRDIIYDPSNEGIIVGFLLASPV